MNVSIVVPAYNEENGLGGVLAQLSAIQAQMADVGRQVEIIIVDDGSTDGTADVARQHDRVTLIPHRVNRGYGAALKTGIRAAKGEWICITDADGTYPNERIPELVEQALTADYDMVVGARTGERVAIPLRRRPAKWAIGKLGDE